MPEVWSCRDVASRCKPDAGPLTVEERAALAAHTATCPACAHRPDVGELLTVPAESVAAAEASQPAAPDAADDAAEEPRSPLTLLLICGAILAAAFAAREARQLARVLRRASATPPAAPSPAEPTPATPATDARPAALPEVAGLMRRIAEADTDRPEALAPLSAALLREAGESGLAARLDALRRGPDAPRAEAARKAQAVLLRAAAARDDADEWRRLKALVQRMALVNVWERLEGPP